MVSVTPLTVCDPLAPTPPISLPLSSTPSIACCLHAASWWGCPPPLPPPIKDVCLTQSSAIPVCLMLFLSLPFPISVLSVFPRDHPAPQDLEAQLDPMELM